MAQPYRVTRWTGPGFPTEADLTARLAQEGAVPVVRAIPPGYREAVRRRPYAVTLWVITGILAVQFANGNGTAREAVLRAGDRIDTQPGAAFRVSAADAGYVAYLMVTPFRLPAVAATAQEQLARQPRSA